MAEKNENRESKRRTEVKDLSSSEQELSQEEKKNLKGGVIRSVGNGGFGGSGAAAPDPGDALGSGLKSGY